MLQVLAPVRRRYLDALEALFPDTSPVKIARALSFTVILMAAAPFDRGFSSMTGIEAQAESAEVWIATVTTFATAGFKSMCGDPG
jgi:hypothetical protein